MNHQKKTFLKLPKADVHNHFHLGGSQKKLLEKYPKLAAYKSLSIAVNENYVENSYGLSENDILSKPEIEFDVSTLKVNQKGEICPKCQQPTFYNISGCFTCSSCGNSKCG